MNIFVSNIEFREQPADTIVVCCSDGRTRRQVAEFLENQGIEADLYAVPGGPLVLMSGVEVFQDSSLAQRRLKLLAEDHGTKRLILITHGSEDEACQCSMSKILFPSLTPAERVKKQRAALLQAAQRLSTAVPLPIDCYFALVVDDMVQFEKVEG